MSAQPPLPGISASRRRRTTQPPPAANLAAWDLSRAAYDTVAGFLDIPVSKTEWCKRNNRAAHALVEGGRTQAEAVALLQWGFTDPKGKRYFGRISSLQRLIDHWPTMSAMRAESEEDGMFICDDGTVIYGNPNDPAPLSEILAG